MELEAKFRVDDDRIFPALLGLGSLGRFRFEVAPRPEDQRNVYFDTPDRRLRNAQYGLRVRTVGPRRIATLKGAAQARDGMYERDEWEADVESDDPHSWPAGEVRERVLALLGGAELTPTLTIQTRRQHIYAERDGTRVAELSLDEGDINAGSRVQHFRELEIELLKNGERADLDELVELLRGHFTLIPEDRSKLARGLALLDQAEADGQS